MVVTLQNTVTSLTHYMYEDIQDVERAVSGILGQDCTVYSVIWYEPLLALSFQNTPS